MKSNKERKANIKALTIGVAVANAVTFAALTITMACYYSKVYSGEYSDKVNNLNTIISSSSDMAKSVFEPRNDRLKDVRNYISNNCNTYDEATTFLSNLSFTEDTTFQLINSSGVATSSYYNDETFTYTETEYPELYNVYSKTTETSIDDSEYHCVTQFTDPFTNNDAFALYTRFNISGQMCTLISTGNSSDILNTLNHQNAFDSLEIALLDNEGNYLVVGNKTLTGNNYFNQIKSFDEDTYNEMQKELTDSGHYLFSFSDKQSKKGIVMSLYKVEGQNWYVVGRVDSSELTPTNLHITTAIITSLVLCALVVCDITILIVTNHRLNITMTILKRQSMTAEDEKNEAENANKAKSVFLNNMSHDIRTPMNAIIGYTTLAQANIDNTERVSEYLDKVQLSSKHLLGLINDVLDMSRIESGKLTFENKKTNLNDLMIQIRDIEASSIQQKSLKFFIDTVDVEHEDIICDQLRVNQILLNLLSNSVKFTPPTGNIFVEVSEKPSSDPSKAHYEFRVKDTGIGMSPEFMTRLFEPFEREYTSTVSHTQGTGLGMAITKNIVDLMGGTIDVKSKQNEGSEFIVNLEFEIDDEVNPKSHIVSEYEGQKAFVLSPFPYACDLLPRMFNKLGLVAEASSHTDSALEKIKKAFEEGNPYRALIVSSKMPDKSLVDLVDEIHTISPDSIIIVAKNDRVNFEKDAIEHGVKGFIPSPTLTIDIARALRENINEEDMTPEKMLKSEDFHGAKLLVVEDNALNREIAIEILSEAGFDVEAVADGDLAIEKIKQVGAKFYKAVLMDIQMPTIDGYEATRQIRKLDIPGVKELPILAMTANAFQEDKRMAFEAGMNEHISKPINIEDLITKLKMFVK